MTSTPRFLARTALGALLLTPVVGWTAYQATAERSFDGKITVLLDRQLPGGKWELVDRFESSAVSFRASLLDAARGKQVRTSFKLSGKTREGRPFSLRLAQPGTVERDLATGSVVLRLPIEWEVDGRRIQRPMELRTDGTIQTPEGSFTGRRLSVQNGSSPIGLVGQAPAGELVDSDELQLASAREPEQRVIFKDLGATVLHVQVQGTVKALDQ